MPAAVTIPPRWRRSGASLSTRIVRCHGHWASTHIQTCMHRRPNPQVTPDGQRTMRTCLAAAACFRDPGSVPAELVQGAGLVHCEGYCLYRPGLTEGLLAAGRATGAATSLDLASLEIVRARWAAVDALLARELVDVVFCNEQEAEAVCQVRGFSFVCQREGGRRGEEGKGNGGVWAWAGHAAGLALCAPRTVVAGRPKQQG